MAESANDHVTKNIKINIEDDLETFIDNLEEGLENIKMAYAQATETSNGEIILEKNKPRNEYDKQVREMGAWIDDKFLKDLLEDNLGGNIEIVSHDIEAAVNAGDNYMGTLYRTNVEYMKNGSDQILVLKLMIKGVPSGQALIDMIDDKGLFDMEIFIYKSIFPKMRVIFKKYLPKPTPFFAPFSYKCMRNNTIVMEDLREKHYIMADRRKQLDFNQAAEVLKSVARFHALSLRVIEENPEYVELIRNDMYINNAVMGDLFVGGTPAFLEIMKTWDGCGKFVPVVNDLCEAWKKNLMAKLLKPGKLNVVNHGDLWVTNFLFNYNQDGSVNHSVLIDFQILRFASPVLDILHLLFSSVRYDAFVPQMNALLWTYYNTFMETLKAINFQLNYTFLQFREEFEERIAFGFLSLLILKPIMMADDKHEIGADEPDNNEDPTSKNINNPRYKDSTIAILEYLDSIGYLFTLQKYLKEFLSSESQVDNEIDDQNGNTNEIPENLENSPGFLNRVLTSFNNAINEPFCS